MEKTFTVKKCLFEDVLEDVFVSLSERAANQEIPAWGSYDVDRVERNHPDTDYHVSLHEGPHENPGEVVALVSVNMVEGEDTTEVSVEWQENETSIVENAQGERWEVRLHCGAEMDARRIDANGNPLESWKEISWNIFCENHGIDTDSF